MTGASSRRKGLEYERHVRTWWSSKGWNVTNRNRSGFDGDDLHIHLPRHLLSVEAKNQATLQLAGWVDQATTNAPPNSIPIVIHKRRGKSDVGQHYVTMSVADLEQLLHTLR